MQQLSAHALAEQESDRKRHEDSVLLRLISEDEQSAASFPIYEIPFANDHFYGRDRELNKIMEHLRFPSASKESLVVSITGLGGMGKSSLATAFVEKCKEEKVYDAIIWVRSETIKDIKASFNHTANRLELARASHPADNDSNVFSVKNWLGKTCEYY